MEFATRAKRFYLILGKMIFFSNSKKNFYKTTNMGQVQTIPDDDTTSINNINFYTNKLESTPNGGYHKEIIANWMGNWELLEDHHGK